MGVNDHKICLLAVDRGKILLKTTGTLPFARKLKIKSINHQVKSILGSQFEYVKHIFTKKEKSGILVEYFLCLVPDFMVPNKHFFWVKLNNSLGEVSSKEKTIIKRLILHLNKPKTILVTGTPCTGKTTFSRKLSLFSQNKYLDVNKIIKKAKLDFEYDKERETSLIEINKLKKAVVDEIKQSNTSLIIDSHMSHDVPSKYADLCVILACKDIKVLKHRLEKRGYNRLKIRENLDAEIFQTCKIDAIEMGHAVVVLDSSKNIDIKGFVKRYNALFKKV